MLLTSALSALWLASFAQGAVQADEDGTVKSIGVWSSNLSMVARGITLANGTL